MNKSEKQCFNEIIEILEKLFTCDYPRKSSKSTNNLRKPVNCDEQPMMFTGRQQHVLKPRNVTYIGGKTTQSHRVSTIM
jgi:hypothetical protein